MNPAAIPELLDTLHLDGSIVTLDAMGCQKDIAAWIRAKGADYFLVLKANHGRAFEAVRGHFDRTCFSRGSGGRPAFDAFDDSHGRLVRRRVFMSPAPGEPELLHEWPDRCTLLTVETIRSINGTGKNFRKVWNTSPSRSCTSILGSLTTIPLGSRMRGLSQSFSAQDL